MRNYYLNILSCLHIKPCVLIHLLNLKMHVCVSDVSGSEHVLSLCPAGFNFRRFFKEMRGNALDKKSNYELLE